MRNLTLIAGFAGLLVMWQPAFSESGHNHKKSETEETHDDHGHEHNHDKKKKKKKHDDHKGHDHGEDHKNDKTEDTHDHGAHESHGNHKKHADSHGHDDEPEKFGEGKAITAVMNEGESFSLSSKAVETLGIQFGSVTQQSKNLIIPSSALVEYQENTGVYVKTEQWLKLVPVKILEEQSGHYVVTSNALNPGDEIVISQTGFVRVAHLEAAGQGGQGHAH